MDSLSSTSEPPAPRPADQVIANADLKHAPSLPPVTSKTQLDAKPCDVLPIKLKIKDSRSATVAGFLHVPKEYKEEQHHRRQRTAAILVSGANGGVVGPSSIYLSVADKLASLKGGIPILRLDYRYPAMNRYCVHDLQHALDCLQEDYGVTRFVLVGWSFGGAPVFTVGGSDERIVGCATLASQTSDTEGIAQVAAKGLPVLLLHGTGDRILSPGCAEELHDTYLHYSPGGDCTRHLFRGDDHAFSKNSLKAEEMLCTFIMRCAGTHTEEPEAEAVIRAELVPENRRLDLMREAGDLSGREQLQ